MRQEGLEDVDGGRALLLEVFDTRIPPALGILYFGDGGLGFKTVGMFHLFSAMYCDCLCVCI
jgi:hypothetical protein